MNRKLNSKGRNIALRLYYDLVQQYEAEGKYFQRLALQEEMKSLPWTAVWDMFCLQNDVPVGEDYIAEIEKYEAEVTSKR